MSSEISRCPGIITESIPVDIVGGEEAGHVVVVLQNYSHFEETLLLGTHHKVVCLIFVVDYILEVDSRRGTHFFEEGLVEDVGDAAETENLLSCSRVHSLSQSPLFWGFGFFGGLENGK